MSEFGQILDAVGAVFADVQTAFMNYEVQLHPAWEFVSGNMTTVLLVSPAIVLALMFGSAIKKPNFSFFEVFGLVLLPVITVLPLAEVIGEQYGGAHGLWVLVPLFAAVLFAPTPVEQKRPVGVL